MALVRLYTFNIKTEPKGLKRVGIYSEESIKKGLPMDRHKYGTKII